MGLCRVLFPWFQEVGCGCNEAQRYIDSRAKSGADPSTGSLKPVAAIVQDIGGE